MNKDNSAPAVVNKTLTQRTSLPSDMRNAEGINPTIGDTGPVAWELFEAFDLGEDEKHISTVDADGVALAAIQELHELLREEDEKISCLEKRNTELERRLGALEELVKKLADHQGDQR